MLLRIIFKNLLSFNDEVQFDMFPNPKRRALTEHVVNREEMPLLKMASVYGPNGAGKSNLVKGISFLKSFVTEKDYIEHLQAEGDFDRLFFCLKDKIEPFSIFCEFSNNKKYFIYKIRVSKKEIQEESLYISGLGEKENVLIFKRSGTDIVFTKQMPKEILAATRKMLAKNRWSSLMSLNDDFPILSNDMVGVAYEWFSKKLIVVDINTRIPQLIELLRKNSNILNYANEVFNKVDLGINSLTIKDEDFDEWAKSHSYLSSPISKVKDLKGINISLFNNHTQAFTIIKNKVYQFLFRQGGANGYEGSLDAISQSDGTIRLLTLMPALYNCTNKDYTAIIDEINNCMHPMLVEGIIRLFSQNDKTKGQLIFTTHDIELMDVDNLMRSDEIWFADKRNGSTIFYSHNIFKEHNTLNILRGYKEGRFGAIRYMK